MDLFKEEFINLIIDQFGITKKEFRKLYPNDEDLWIPLAKLLIEKRKIEPDDNLTLRDFISNYKNYGNNNAELLTILKAMEISPEIKEMNSNVEIQRNEAFKKILNSAIAKGEISAKFFEQFNIEIIARLFFDIVDIRTANANVNSQKSNVLIFSETKKILNIFYGFLSRWDNLKDNTVKFIKFIVDYHFTIVDELFDYKVRNVVEENINIDYSEVTISKKPIAFTIMQYTNDYNELYNKVIKPIAETFGYDCIRADDIHKPGIILDDIIHSISNAMIIIAEISEANPNVYFELGYSFAMQKTIILLCNKNGNKLPFDISSFRVLFYNNTIFGKSEIETELSKFLENINLEFPKMTDTELPFK